MGFNTLLAVSSICVFLIQGTASSVEFEDGPTAAEAILGTSVTIECNAKAPLAECQWYWKSSKDNTSSPITVSTFAAYGNDNRSCSVRFKIAGFEQEGIWICGARTSLDENFSLSPPISFAILQPTRSSAPRRKVQFAEITKDISVKIGMPMHLICKTAEPVKECMWAWRANATAPIIPIKHVEPFGDQHLNCDLRFDHVTPDDNGIWTCRARYEGEADFTEAKSIHVTIMTEVGFVQLSQDIQVSVGEQAFLRCLTNIGVQLCRWTWRALDSTNKQVVDVIKEFPPYGPDARDCSIKLKNTSEEHAGYWRCHARLNKDTPFKNASSAKLTILYPVEPSFFEDPQDTLAALGEPTVLRCVASRPMIECSWYWRPLKSVNRPPLLVKTFPPFDEYKRDCSVRFKRITTEQEGVWGCNVRGSNKTITSKLAKLNVYDAGPISFVELTQNVVIYPGASLQLKCTTTTRMEQCRWTWQAPNQTTTDTIKIIKQFAPEKEGKDCTIRLTNVMVEESGRWTCCVRRQKESELTYAPPVHVKVLQPETVTVAIWSSPKNSVTLACRLNVPREDAVCRWYQPPRMNISETNHTTRYNVHHKKSTGVCTLNFIPEKQDLARWACGFNVLTDAGDWEMASANIILLSPAHTGFSLEDNKMGWLIGILAMMVLILTAALVTVSVYQCCRSNTHDHDIHVGGVNQSPDDTTSRYTDAPTKINFQFREKLEIPTKSEISPPKDQRSDSELVAPSVSPDSKSQHIYERVTSRYISPNSLYENIDKE